MDIAGGKPSSLDVVVRFLVVRFPCRTGLFGGMALAGGKPSLLDVVRFLVVLPCRTVQARTRLLLNSSTMRNIVTINFSTSARLRPPAPHPRFHFELLRWTTYEICHCYDTGGRDAGGVEPPRLKSQHLERLGQVGVGVGITYLLPWR